MPRSGPSLLSMPSLGDIDDMIKQTLHAQKSLSTLRERIEMQQAEIAEQSQRETAERIAQGQVYSERPMSQVDAKMGIFPPSDAKKRRGGVSVSSVRHVQCAC